MAAGHPGVVNSFLKGYYWPPIRHQLPIPHALLERLPKADGSTRQSAAWPSDLKIYVLCCSIWLIVKSFDVL